MSPDKVTKPVDVYVRVSRRGGREDESFRSPDQQEKRCRAQLAADGLKVGRVFTDIDQSGGKASRPQFDLMMERVASGKSGGVVVYDLSRFGRNTRNVLDGIDFLEQHGAVFISCQEKLDTSTDSGRFMLTVFAALREMELRQLGARFLVSRQDAIADGVYISAHVPAGYRRGKEGRLEPHPKHGLTITKAFEMAAAGAAPTDIARFLTEQGLPSGDNENAVWRSSRIKRLLSNRAYLGEARSGEIRNPNAHPPLTYEVTWLRAQRPSTTRVRQDSNALLAGLVRCAGCRRSMKSQAASGRAPRTYRCSSNNSNASYTCPCPSTITAERLEELVLDAFLERTFSEERKSSEKPTDDTALLEERLEAAKKAVSEIGEAKDTFRSRLAYGQTLDAALADLEEAEAALAQTRAPGFDDYDIARLVNSALPLLDRSKAFDTEGIMTVREALARDLQAVFVRPSKTRNSRDVAERVRIVWADEEQLELPVRGKHRELPPYIWEEA